MDKGLVIRRLLRNLHQKVRLIKEDPDRVYYAIKGFLLWFVLKRYIIRYLRKTVECRKCYEQGSCIHCGCPIDEMFVSGFDCRKRITMWETKTIDLGTVAQGNKVAFAFNYTGDSNIITIQASCSCTDVIAVGTAIKGTLNVQSFPTYGLINNVENVPMAKTIDVATRDGKNHVLTLNYKIKNPNR